MGHPPPARLAFRLFWIWHNCSPVDGREVHWFAQAWADLQLLGQKQLTECRWGKPQPVAGHTAVQRKRGHQCQMASWSCGACVRRVMEPKVPGDKPGGWGIGKQVELEHQCRQDGLQHSVSTLRELQEGDHQLGLRLRHHQRTVCSRHMGGGGKAPLVILTSSLLTDGAAARSSRRVPSCFLHWESLTSCTLYKTNA